MRFRTIPAVASLVVMAFAASAANPVAAEVDGGSVHDARAAIEKYEDVAVAEADGYAVLADLQGITCIVDPGGTGAMGIHYVNGTAVGDAVIDPLIPEALLYEPTAAGLKLRGAEYVVFKDVWGSGPPPVLFGHEFMLVEEPNRYGIPAFYELHAWLKYRNPNGLFNDWNPRVRCPA